MWCEKITARMLRMVVVGILIGLSWGCTSTKPTPDRSALITKHADEATIPKVPDQPRVVLVTGPVATVYGRAISPRWLNMKMLTWRRDTLNRIKQLSKHRHRHSSLTYALRSLFRQMAYQYYEEMLLDGLQITLSEQEKQQALVRYKRLHLLTGYDKQVRLWGDEAPLLTSVYHQARLRKLVTLDTTLKVKPEEVTRRMRWLRRRAYRRRGKLKLKRVVKTKRAPGWRR